MKMGSIKAEWIRINDKLANVSIRERAMMLVTLLVAFIFIWLQFVYTPLSKKKNDVIQNMQALDNKIVTTSDLMTQMQNRLTHNPNLALREKAQILQKQIASQRQRIEKRVQHLLQPEQMADVVKNMLGEFGHLKLLRIQNLPVEPFLESGKGVKGGSSGQKRQINTNTEEDDVQLYQHGLELEVKGRYFDIVHYLQRLEKVNGFSWEQLDYKVKKYPVAIVKIRIKTISLDEGWIGV
jgi:MSHA biogenesis protein MshJ